MLEPPDGAIFVAGVLRQCVESASQWDVDQHDDNEEDHHIILSTDLKNAYGLVHRHALLGGPIKKAPGLSSFL